MAGLDVRHRYIACLLYDIALFHLPQRRCGVWITTLGVNSRGFICAISNRVLYEEFYLHV